MRRSTWVPSQIAKDTLHIKVIAYRSRSSEPFSQTSLGHMDKENQTSAISTRTYFVLNVLVLSSIVGFCIVFSATLVQFTHLLFGWYAMAGWVRFACDATPEFNGFRGASSLSCAYAISVFLTTCVALGHLVMGDLPLVGVVYLFTFSAVPELARFGHRGFFSTSEPN